MFWFLALALILLLFGWLSMKRATALQRQTGLPEGRLVYADTGDQDWRPTTPLYSANYNLIGKPDYLVETTEGVIPVEVKSRPAPAVPYLGHLLQLAAYCLLVEETTGYTPPHGFLKYTDALYEVDFTGELRGELLDTMVSMHQAWLVDDVERSHDQAGRCAACGFRNICEEKLSQ